MFHKATSLLYFLLSLRRERKKSKVCIYGSDKNSKWHEHGRPWQDSNLAVNEEQKPGKTSALTHLDPVDEPGISEAEAVPPEFHGLGPFEPLNFGQGEGTLRPAFVVVRIPPVQLVCLSSQAVVVLDDHPHVCIRPCTSSIAGHHVHDQVRSPVIRLVHRIPHPSSAESRLGLSGERASGDASVPPYGQTPSSPERSRGICGR